MALKKNERWLCCFRLETVASHSDYEISNSKFPNFSEEKSVSYVCYRIPDAPVGGIVFYNIFFCFIFNPFYNVKLI